MQKNVHRLTSPFCIWLQSVFTVNVGSRKPFHRLWATRSNCADADMWLRRLSSASLRFSPTLNPQQGVRSVWKLLADKCFKGWYFAPEMRRRIATECSCFCRALPCAAVRCLLCIFHFITSRRGSWPTTCACHERLSTCLTYALAPLTLTFSVLTTETVLLMWFESVMQMFLTRRGCGVRCKCWKMRCICFLVISPNQINGSNQRHVLRRTHC